MTAKNNKEIENKVKVCATIQVERGLGARLNPPDVRDVHLAQVQAPVAVPMQYDTDLSILPTENQKDKGTCVGQGEGKGMEYFEVKETKKFTRLSKRYLYIKCKEIDGIPNEQGTFPRTAAKVLFDNGIAEERLVPDNNDLPYSEYMKPTLTDEVGKNARIRRVNGYAVVANSIDAIKQAIYQNGVVSATLQVGDWSSMPLKPLPSAGLHRILFKGYREFMNGAVRDLEIRFRNSWGPEWGMQGEGVILWSEYKDFIYDLMTYVDLPNEVIEDLKTKPYQFTKTLKKESYGVEVMELQKRLSKTPEKFYNYKKNGSLYFSLYFGNETEKALKAYQKARGIVSFGTPSTTGYGQLGPKTRAKINAEPIYTDSEPQKKNLIKLIPTGTMRRSGKKIDPIKYIVCHDTGNSGSTAMQNVDYMIKSADEMSASAHYFVDDQYAINCIPETEKAWHVRYNAGIAPNVKGSYANDCSISVELCYGGKIDNQTAYKNYVSLVQDICNRYALTTKALFTHKQLDPTRRTDPENALVLVGKTWDQFVADVGAGLTTKVEINSPKEHKNMLTTIAVILLILWLLGLVGVYTIGAFLHVILVIAVIVFVIDLINRRR